MFASVIVPLDGSPFGEQALPLAISVARRAKIPLQIVQVHVPWAPLNAEYRPNLESAGAEVARRQCKKFLDETVSHIKALVSVPVHVTLLDGSVGEALRGFSGDHPDSLVVMTTHGRGPISRFWLGSVTDAFVRVTAGPVLLVHPVDENKPALGDDPTLSRMLIPVDGSLLSEEILEPAITLGKLMGSHYTLLRVVEPLPFVGQSPVGDGVVIDPDWIKEEEVIANSYLASLAGRLRDRSLHVCTRMRHDQSAPRAILDEARAEGMNCIAISSHGQRGLMRMALGSVADKVVRGGILPTLLVRPHTS